MSNPNLEDAISAATAFSTDLNVGAFKDLLQALYSVPQGTETDILLSALKGEIEPADAAKAIKSVMRVKAKLYKLP